MTVLTRSLDIEVASSLYQAGTTGDGHPYSADAYFVTATSADGSRWAHATTFPGCDVVHDDDEGATHFLDIRESAKLAAEKLCAEIKLLPAIELCEWSSMEPVYGSSAYQRNGGGESDLAMQERDDERGPDFR